METDVKMVTCPECGMAKREDEWPTHVRTTYTGEHANIAVVDVGYGPCPNCQRIWGHETYRAVGD